MKLGLAFRNQLNGISTWIVNELDSFTAQIVGWSNREHDDEGGHTNVTATTIETTGDVTVGGDLTSKGAWYIDRNAAAVLTPTQITADQIDYNPPGLATALVLRLSTNSSQVLHSMVTDQSQGRWLALFNVGNNDLVLKHNSGSGTVGYTFSLPGSTDQTIASGEGYWLFYDGSSGTWRVPLN